MIALLTKSLLKVCTLLIVVSFLSTSNLFAQAEITGFGGYMTYSSVPVAEGNLSFDDGPNYGLGLSFEVERGLQAELMWLTQQTKTYLQPYSGGREYLFDMNTHYFQLGAVYEFRHSRKQKAFPFTAVTFGATLFDAKDATITDEWRFSVTLGGGGKFYLSDKVGIRLQARMLLPMNFSSVGIWCGTGGCSAGVGSWATFVSFDFTGGIFIRLGK